MIAICQPKDGIRSIRENNNAFLRKRHGADDSHIRIHRKLNITALRLAGMGMQLIRIAAPNGVDAPSQIVRFIEIVSQVNHRGWCLNIR